MTKTPADILRRARIERGFDSAAGAARHFGWSIATYTSHENGTRGIRVDAAQEYGKAFKISVSSLLGLSSPKLTINNTSPIDVVGEAASGVWREEKSFISSVQSLPIPYTHDMPSQKALRIADDTINKFAPRGSYAIYTAIAIEQVKFLEVGKFIVVSSTRNGLTETTIRRVSSIDGNVLRTSTHAISGALYAAHAIDLDTLDGVRIDGVVVGLYTPIE